MSVSKLESLPNEILSDIFEKYLNGVDILVAFAFQLNQRFDALILQSQRFRFNFIGCHKNDFRLCIGLLPAYTNKIEELALSEQNTPGQIHAFLSYFPSFDIFKRLRKLYFHVNAETVEAMVLRTALRSLSKTSLHTLILKTKDSQSIYPLNNALSNIFGLKTLKKLSIIGGFNSQICHLLQNISLDLEHLTIYGMYCNLAELESIFCYAPRLKYLNIGAENFLSTRSIDEISSLKRKVTMMPTLHTAIFNFGQHNEEIFNTLEPCLLHMPFLQRLEINANSVLFHGDEWETFLMTSLPNLTHFNLKSHGNLSRLVTIRDSLESFQTPFWIERKNFNIIISPQKQFVPNSLFIYEPQKLNQMTPNYPICHCWLAPRRDICENLYRMNEISSFELMSETSTLLQYYYFDNINYLVLRDLNYDLFEWTTKHINYSRIRYLDVSQVDNKLSIIPLLLSCTQNIVFLKIRFNELITHQSEYLGKCPLLKCLDISFNQHNIVKADFVIIKTLFPNIEHLIINTQHFKNIPKLYTYYPRLRSLTLEKTFSDYSSDNDSYERRMIEYNMLKKANFLSEDNGKYITVWTDQAALQNSYWKNFGREHTARCKMSCSLI